MKENVLIKIPCQPHESLDWEPQIQQALQALSDQRKIVWEFDIGLQAPYFPLEEELRFQSISLALTTFTKDLWPRFQETTENAILYRGSADFSRYFKWSAAQETNWSIWKEERLPCEEGHLRRLFCAEAFVAYFQMLAHRLPDELPLHLILDASDTGTLAQTYHLLLSERFEHFVLEISGIPERSQNASTGICFPQDALCSGEILQRLDALFQTIQEPCRPISESLMTEQWEGLDTLHILSGSVSSQGKRKLMGFCAAGGTVVENSLDTDS